MNIDLEQLFENAGVNLAKKNSLGQNIVENNDMTALLNFWNWFGDSKCIDGRGRPLVLYHGSRSNQQITRFDVKRGSHIDAVYFTNKPSVGSHWAGSSIARRKTDTLMQSIYQINDPKKLIQILKAFGVSAKITTHQFPEGEFFRLQEKDGNVESSSPLGYKTDNPLIFNMDGREVNLLDELRGMIAYQANYAQTSNLYGCYLKMENPLVVDAGKKPYWQIPFPPLNKTTTTETIAEYAKQNGFDGAIIKNVYETDYENQLCTDYIVFSSNQIKSAYDNNGEFSPESENIYESK